MEQRPLPDSLPEPVLEPKLELVQDAADVDEDDVKEAAAPTQDRGDRRDERGSAPATASAAGRRAGDDDRRAAALLARGWTPSAAERRAGGRARQAHRARRHGREADDDPVEPAPRRLDREELPQPGPSVPRPDPRRHPRADPRGREVRLAPRLQVLDLRDLVDPAGRRPGAGRQGADDPDARAHRRADAEAESRRADALDA